MNQSKMNFKMLFFIWNGMLLFKVFNKSLNSWINKAFCFSSIKSFERESISSLIVFEIDNILFNSLELSRFLVWILESKFIKIRIKTWMNIYYTKKIMYDS
jgi:hypothetical protein